VFELSRAVVKVDTKVINASLSQNQRLQCVPPSAGRRPLRMLKDRDARRHTELNNDGMIKLGDVQYQTERNLSTFSDSDLINDDSSFCLQILLTNDLQCCVFPSGKLLFIKCPSLSVNGIFDDRMMRRHLHITMLELQYWVTFLIF